jgi:endonuclease/exonuclease/phosphatase family metal-dependent hydrolase
VEGYRNLIKDFGIKSTRGRICWEQYKHKPGFTKQFFADYIFVSKRVGVKGFQVPHIEISDHLPLILDFEI